MSYVSEKLAEQFLRFSYDSGLMQNIVWIEKHNTKQKDKYLERELIQLFDKPFSASWSLGGTSGGYDGSKYEVSAEREPDMEKLDNFLLAYYPTLGFLQYKRITQKVDVDTSYDSDYYGGSTTHMTKSLQLDALDKSLIEFNYLSHTEKEIHMTPANLLALYKRTVQVDILASIGSVAKKAQTRVKKQI